MTKLILSTVKRHVKSTDPSGHIYVFEINPIALKNQIVIIEPPFRDMDTNPRGGMRGARGIVVFNNEIYVSNYSAIFCFNTDWQLIKTFSHPSCAGIHDFIIDGDLMWVTSAANDSIAKFNIEGEYIESINATGFVKKLNIANGRLNISARNKKSDSTDFRNASNYEKEEFDRMHINSICNLPSGEIPISLGLLMSNNFASLIKLKNALILLGAWRIVTKINKWLKSIFKNKKGDSDLIVQPVTGYSAVIKLKERDNAQLLYTISNVNVPSHSLLPLSTGEILYLNTTEGKILWIDADSGKLKSTTDVGTGFLRGAIELPDKMLLIGNGNELISISQNGTMTRTLLFEDKFESVFAIQILPDNFAEPPKSLSDITGIVESFDGQKVIFNRK